MDNQRLLLFLALGLVTMLLWEAWDKDYGLKPLPRTVTSSTESKGQQSPPSDIPMDSATNIADVPMNLPSQSAVESTPQAQQEKPPSGVEQAKTGQRITVQTDLLEVQISTLGGDIRQVNLAKFFLKAGDPENLFRLLDDQTPPDIYIAQSGLLSRSKSAPDHRALYTAQQTNYRLESDQEQIKVVLNWQGQDGIEVAKIFTFSRDSYVIDVEFEVKNSSTKTWKGRSYTQLQRTQPEKSGESSFIYTYMGGVVSTAENIYQKVDFTDMAEWKAVNNFNQGGWVAMVQHYFVAAVIPSQDQLNHFYTNIFDNSKYIIGAASQDVDVPIGETRQFKTQMFVGPKDQGRMEKAAKNLELTVDYGILTVLSKPLFWLLKYIHSVIQNWGWSIIVLTMMIKLIFFKLSEASYKSMAKMRKFQPKFASIRERYGSDRQRMSQATMELYKKEKINPLGGCLPVVVQIPVFIALYWVLLESVELRQAPFMFWINDLSTKDPFYVLPVIMGATMFLQHKLNPAPIDPIQQKVMMSLPFIFTLFFAFFPSGLVLYWVANNVLSISQQWYITRKIEKAGS